MNDWIRSKHVEQTKNCEIKVDYKNCASCWSLTHSVYLCLNRIYKTPTTPDASAETVTWHRFHIPAEEYADILHDRVVTLDPVSHSVLVTPTRHSCHTLHQWRELCTPNFPLTRF